MPSHRGIRASYKEKYASANEIANAFRESNQALVMENLALKDDMRNIRQTVRSVLGNVGPIMDEINQDKWVNSPTTEAWRIFTTNDPDAMSPVQLVIVLADVSSRLNQVLTEVYQDQERLLSVLGDALESSPVIPASIETEPEEEVVEMAVISELGSTSQISRRSSAYYPQ